MGGCWVEVILGYGGLLGGGDILGYGGLLGGGDILGYGRLLGGGDTNVRCVTVTCNIVLCNSYM